MFVNTKLLPCVHDRGLQLSWMRLREASLDSVLMPSVPSQPRLASSSLFQIATVSADGSALPPANILYHGQGEKRTWLWDAWRCLEPDAREEQTRLLAESAVGYMVSKYVLHIQDGHEDNIMLADNGSIFRLNLGYAFGKMPILGAKSYFDAPLVSLPSGVAYSLRVSGRWDFFAKNCITAFQEAGTARVQWWYGWHTGFIPRFLEELQKDEQIARLLRDSEKNMHKLEHLLDTPENFDDKWQSGKLPHFKLEGHTKSGGDKRMWRTVYPQNCLRSGETAKQSLRFEDIVAAVG